MRYLKVALPILVLAAVIIAAGSMTGTPPREGTAEKPAPPRHVEVVPVTFHEIVLDVAAYGSLELREAIDVTAGVAAPVVHISQRLEAGEIVRRGDVLARLDATDFEAAAARTRAAISNAELRLVQEEAEARMAIEEWMEDGEPGPLVTREPQLAQARAELAAVRAELAQAESHLERCVIRAPFDALVRDRRIGRGQYVQPGQVLATIQEVGFAEARVPLTEMQLAALEPEMLSPQLRGEPPVRVEARLAGRSSRRWGRVIRSEGALDQASRMLTLVVRVDDPLAIALDAEPLVPGQFVDVQIRGRSLPRAALLPRSALLDGARVLAVEDGVTRSKRVDVAQIRGETAVISGGLEEGDRIQVSPALGAAEGTPVSPVEVSPPTPGDLGLADFDAKAAES